MLKIHNWNINSIKSRLDLLCDWLQSNQPDVMCLQEIKCIDEQFPYDIIGDLGYNIVISGQKTYNGVAILSKYPFDSVKYEFPDDPDPDQRRFIEVVIVVRQCTYRIISVYVPNGQSLDSDKFIYKMKFLDAFAKYSEDLLVNDENVIICGDFNIAYSNKEVYDDKLLDHSICCSMQERVALRRILNSGYYDSYRIKNPNSNGFSWWDYRGGAWQHNKGLRIDYILMSSEACDNLMRAAIDLTVRNKEKPSDHAIVMAEFE
jgi:exodeoxyribonuclease-3